MKDTKNLIDKEAIDKLKSLVNDINICLFCTNLKAQDVASSGPMTAQSVCDQGNIWFFSELNSERNKDIAADTKVQLFFSHPPLGSYLVVGGEAEIVLDRGKINELWNPVVKTWFPKGKDDPNISVLKVTPTSAFYWDTDSKRMINFLKMAASMAINSNLITGMQGTLKV